MGFGTSLLIELTPALDSLDARRNAYWFLSTSFQVSICWDYTTRPSERQLDLRRTQSHIGVSRGDANRSRLISAPLLSPKPVTIQSIRPIRVLFLGIDVALSRNPAISRSEKIAIIPGLLDSYINTFV